MVKPVKILFAAGLLSTGLLWSGCGESKASSRAEGEAAQKTAPRQVEVGRAQIGSMEETVRATGTLAAQDRAVLSVKAPGRVAEVLVDIGSKVAAGTVLARIEKKDYQLRLEQIQAAEAEARAVFAEAERNLARSRKLREQGIVPEAEIETGEAAFQVASTRVKQREAELHQAEQLLRDTEIVAPFDGMVESRAANLGEFLGAAAPVVTVVRVDPIRLRLEVAELDAPRVKPGQEVRLHDARALGLKGSGKLVRLSPVISHATRMLTVEADLRNAEGMLRPGSFVEADIIVNPARKALVVPANALFTFAGLEKVVTIDQGRAKEVAVKTGNKSKDFVEIISGLKEGTVVVLNPGTIKTGQPLSVTN